MDWLKVYYEMYKNAERVLYKQFGIDKSLESCNIGDINEHYWYINDENNLCYADSKEEFESGDYYCLDNGCDDEVNGVYEFGDYIGIKVGCGEHRDSKFEMFRADRKVAQEDIEE